MLCLFDFNSFTGFSSVSKNLVSNWRRRFAGDLLLDIVAINYFGEDYNYDPFTRVISAKKKDIKEDDFGRHVFLATLAKTDEYDAIFIMQDLGVIIPIITHLKTIRIQKANEGKRIFKSFFYFPVDFSLNSILVKGLEFFEGLYTYTDYGKQMVCALRPELKDKLKVVPHGNNSKDFYHIPYTEINDFRSQYFGANADKFIIANVNRNQSRKDIPTTIFGFLEYWSEYNKHSFLYLHMNATDPMGWHLRTILSQTPLVEGKDYGFPPDEDANKGADISKMNSIYNSVDAFLTTTTGEGWGLTITEAMACRVPVIAPAHTSINEISDNGKRTFLLQTLYPIVAMVDNTIRFQSDLYEIAETIDTVFNLKKTNANALGNKLTDASEYVKSLDWGWIADKFANDFSRLLKIENP